MVYIFNIERTKIIKKLLYKKIDTSIKDNKDRTGYNLAQEKDNKGIIKMLNTFKPKCDNSYIFIISFFILFILFTVINLYLLISNHK